MSEVGERGQKHSKQRKERVQSSWGRREHSTSNTSVVRGHIEREHDRYRRNCDSPWQEFARARMTEGAMAIRQTDTLGLGNFFLDTRGTQNHE